MLSSSGTTVYGISWVVWRQVEQWWFRKTFHNMQRVEGGKKEGREDWNKEGQEEGQDNHQPEGIKWYLARSDGWRGLRRLWWWFHVFLFVQAIWLIRLVLNMENRISVFRVVTWCSCHEVDSPLFRSYWIPSIHRYLFGQSYIENNCWKWQRHLLSQNISE